LILSVCALLWAAPARGAEAAARRADVNQKSSVVMPFALTRTKHIFTPTASGGTQAVLVPDGDPRQIALVRSHLRKESAAFARGDYSDPAAIHGSAMPGLAVLVRSRGRIRVSYAELSNGAKIVFATHDARLVLALHRWFSAQVRDHGSHAAMQMPM
jgi:hypothetical protein